MLKGAKRKPLQQYLLLSTLLAVSASAKADIKSVKSTSCPAGYTHVTYEKATANRGRYCGNLQEWDMVKLL